MTTPSLCRAAALTLTLALCSMAVAALLATAVPALAETCPNEQLRTEDHSTTLPDCRSYELVTPPFKEGSTAGIRVTPTPGGLGGISVDDSKIDLVSLGDFGDAQSGVNFNNYQMTRTEAGWSEQNIDLPASEFAEEEPIDTTPEMKATLYEARRNDQSYKAEDFWLREADGALLDIGPFEPPADTAGPSDVPPGTGVVNLHHLDGGGEFVAASSDLSRVLFWSPDVWPGNEAYGAAGGELYEYLVGQGGPPVPVSIEPDGAPCASTYNSFDGISADGSVVVFSCGGQLFARIDNGEAGARTVAISEPSAADCAACDTGVGERQEAGFVSFSADGSEVFFETSQPLLGGDRSENLYEYNFDAPQASAGDPEGRIARVTSGSWSGGEARLTESIVSEDGSHMYFIAEGVLAGAANDRGQVPIQGAENLYVFQRKGQFSEGLISFVATVNGLGRAETTPDGRFFVFASTADLTPGDTSTAQQIFEYDAQTGELVRCSIGQDGFNDDGNTDTQAAELPFERPAPGAYIPKANRLVEISDDGEYVVFESADGLTPGALNGIAPNVYEYHDGNVYLISDGQDRSSTGVRLEGMSPAGGDILFTTNDQLVGQDLDSESDLYDARIDGGFPAPVSLLPTCSGDACQGPLTGAPVLLSPGSEFQAGGNPPLSEPAPAPLPKSKAKAKPKKQAKSKVKAKRCPAGGAGGHGRCAAVKKARRAVKSARGGR